MAVVLLTGIVLGAAADSYLDLSGASRIALERSREAREAVALLDRMARDLEGAVLVAKPEGDERLGHPWLFYAEADSEVEGARRLKFVTRSHRPRATDAPESDLAVVAFVADSGDDGTLVLRRALSPTLGDELDRTFPRDERDGADVLADHLARFGMRFLTEEGALEASFDSTGIVHTDQLPLAVEIELAFAREDEEGTLVEGPLYARQVKLPLRPLDLAGELGVADEEAAADEEEGDETADGMTVQECLAKNPAILSELDVPPEVLDSIREQPISAVGLTEGDCE
jgi:hypothetical protein